MSSTRSSGKIVIIVQARMTSTRLPGKVLKKIAGKSLLEYLIERLQRVCSAQHLVIATTTNKSDSPIADLCARLKVTIFRGDENDVLGRYYFAARNAGADTIVRVTSDCPLMDPAVVDEVIQRYCEGPALAFVHNSPGDDARRSFPRGMDVEVFSNAALTEAHRLAKTPAEREHVTLYFRRNPEQFPERLVEYHEKRGAHRLCVDTNEDFALIGKIIGGLSPANSQFSIRDIFRVLDDNPSWHGINAKVPQKHL